MLGGEKDDNINYRKECRQVNIMCHSIKLLILWSLKEKKNYTMFFDHLVVTFYKNIRTKKNLAGDN